MVIYFVIYIYIYIYIYYKIDYHNIYILQNRLPQYYKDLGPINVSLQFDIKASKVVRD